VQEFSFKLKLLTATGKDTSNMRPLQIKPLIDFFKTCLFQEKNFTVNIEVSKESEELYNSHRKVNNFKTVEEFISSAPLRILLKGITIKLQANVKDIDLGNLHKIKLFLNEKLKCAEEIKGEKQSQDTPQAEKTKSGKERNIVQEENIQDKQVASIKGSFGYNVVSNRKQITRAPVIVAAIRENVSWLKSFFRLPNLFDTIEFPFRQPQKLSRKQRALAYQLLKETEPNEVIQQNKGETEETAKLSDIGQTKSHTDCFKANRRKKSKKQAKALSEEEKQLAVRQAQNDARVAMIDNQAEYKGKKLDKIFVEVMNGYKNQDPETFRNIFNSVFNIVYFQDKQLHEILEPGEVLEVLQILERPQPSNNSLLGKEYLQRQVYRKKEQLLKLVSGIPIQQPFPQPENVSHEGRNPLPNKTTNSSPATSTTPPATNTAFKPLLKIVFSSKETYFCLLLIAFSISTLCLWHLPLGKVSILKGLVPPEKRESVGLTLNIGLPILATLCVLSLAYFIYSKYSVESIEQVGENKPLAFT